MNLIESETWNAIWDQPLFAFHIFPIVLTYLCCPLHCQTLEIFDFRLQFFLTKSCSVYAGTFLLRDKILVTLAKTSLISGDVSKKMSLTLWLKHQNIQRIQAASWVTQKYPRSTRNNPIRLFKTCLSFSLYQSKDNLLLLCIIGYGKVSSPLKAVEAFLYSTVWCAKEGTES